MKTLPSTIVFEPVVWPHRGATSPPNHVSARLTAHVATPKPRHQYDGTLMASGVQWGMARYLVLDVSDSAYCTVHERDPACIYQAFETDLTVVPAQWQRQGWQDPPDLMCRAAALEGYAAQPFWGWEVHMPTPGEGWHLLSGQNVERRLAPAHQWVKEIQGELLPRLQARLTRLSQVSERYARLYRIPEGSAFAHVPPLEPNPRPSPVSQHALLRDNLPGTVETVWRWPYPSGGPDPGLERLEAELKCLPRRLVQAQWLIAALRPLGTQPIEMQRTMLRAEREFSLPVPKVPLAIAVRNPVAPGVRIRMR